MEHTYSLEIRWNGSSAQPTLNYSSYTRDHQIEAPKKAIIEGSADPHFRGDPTKYNPEELFLSSISSCHMLWYLHLCSDNGIAVLSYKDLPLGIMTTTNDGSGKFSKVTLRPEVLISSDSDITLAQELHEKAHAMCFIANSCNFQIYCKSSVRFDDKP